MHSLAGLTHFFLPEIHSSVPSHLHSDYEIVEKSTHEFLFQIAQCSSDAEKEILRQWRVPLLTCLTNPEADCSRLVAASQIISWGFLMDDDIEEARGKSNHAAKSISAEAVWAVVNGTARPEQIATQAMLAFKNLWDVILAGMPPSLKQRFVKSMKDHLRAVALANRVTKDKNLPTVESFISTRRLTGAASIFLNLAEYSLGVDLDERVLNTEKLIALHRAAADHLAWVNDIFSFRKEYLEGDFHNLLSVMCVNYRCSFQEVVNRVCNMIRKREEDYVRLVGEISASDELQQHEPGLRKYLKAVGFWMSGNLLWSYQSGRYHGLNNVLVPFRSVVIHVRPDDETPSKREIILTSFKSLERERKGEDE